MKKQPKKKERDKGDRESDKPVIPLSVSSEDERINERNI